MISTTIKKLILISILVFFSSNIFAIDASKVPEDRQSTTGLYFTSLEASDHVAKQGDSTLFIDIRDPVDIFTVGMPNAVDTNVTFKYVDPSLWNEKKSTFGFKSNPNFLKDVDIRLKEKGLTNSDTIILICGSGKRAAKAASALKKAGFSNVYSVMDGYKAWQKADLEWSRKLDKQKVLVK